MPQADTFVLRVPLSKAVWPARRHVVANAAQLGAIDRVGSVMIGVDTSDATHEDVIRSRSAETLLWYLAGWIAGPPARSECPLGIVHSPTAGCARGSRGRAVGAGFRLRSGAAKRLRGRR